MIQFTIQDLRILNNLKLIQSNKSNNSHYTLTIGKYYFSIGLQIVSLFLSQTHHNLNTSKSLCMKYEPLAALRLAFHPKPNGQSAVISFHELFQLSSESITCQSLTLANSLPEPLNSWVQIHQQCNSS